MKEDESEIEIKPFGMINYNNIIEILLKYFKRFIKNGNLGPHTIGRLILIKKKPKEIPNNNNLRPIVISSIIMKLLETILLNNAKQILLNSYSKY